MYCGGKYFHINSSRYKQRNHKPKLESTAKQKLMKFVHTFPLALLVAIHIFLSSQGADALTSEEIGKIAQKFAVRIDGENTGSGVVVECENGLYKVLTNWHVVKRFGNYTVTVGAQPLGQSYKIDYYEQIKRHPSLDLALVQFKGSKSCNKADLKKSSLNVGTVVYTTGWANSSISRLSRNYRFDQGMISGFRTSTESGYSLILTNPIQIGMSGGPIISESGQVVGISGLLIKQNSTLIDALGIPISRFKESEFIPISPPKPFPEPQIPAAKPEHTTKCTPVKRFGRRFLKSPQPATTQVITLRFNDVYVFQSGHFEVNLKIENRQNQPLEFIDSDIEVLTFEGRRVASAALPTIGKIRVDPRRTVKLKLHIKECWKEKMPQDLILRIKDIHNNRFDNSF